MKKVYLALAVIGTVLPNIFVLLESARSGNYLLYAHPIDTFQGMFANYISAAFVTDLLFIVILFLFWSFREAKKYDMRNVLLFWIYTFALGIAGGLPLFLYFRELKRETVAESV